MNKIQTQTHRNLWEKPWGYAESFFIGFGLMFTGFLIEAFVTTNVNAFLIKYPYNVIVLVGYITVLFVCYKWFTSSQVIRWLTKVPASISSIVLITIMVMIMGTIPQVPSNNAIINKLGLNHITTNWAFLLILFQFLIPF